MYDTNNLSQETKLEAFRLGFDLCRFGPVQTAPHADFFDGWLASDCAGEMTYLTRNISKRRDPGLLTEEGGEPFRSMIVLAVNHHQFALPRRYMEDPSRGIIASYAWSDDYHEIIRPVLYELDAFIRSRSGRTSKGKCLVDTGPVLERDWALQLGIGFTGKNCCTIHPRVGSWLLLAVILIPEYLQPDRPLKSLSLHQPPAAPPSPRDVLNGLPPGNDYGRWEIPLDSLVPDSSKRTATLFTQPESRSQRRGQVAVGTCGRCTRCLDDCPTDAFVGPYYLDPQLCISYWTIEARSPIPRELRQAFGNRIFGCDICQEVCPWNRRLEERVPHMQRLAAQMNRVAPPLLEGFRPAMPYWLDQGAFSARFRGSAIKRAKRSGMLRNVAVALGNWGDPVVVNPLLLTLRDPDPLPRGHAAWALGEVRQKHGIERIDSELNAALSAEDNEWVREEISLALR